MQYSRQTQGLVVRRGLADAGQQSIAAGNQTNAARLLDLRRDIAAVQADEIPPGAQR